MCGAYISMCKGSQMTQVGLIGICIAFTKWQTDCCRASQASHGNQHGRRSFCTGPHDFCYLLQQANLHCATVLYVHSTYAHRRYLEFARASARICTSAWLCVQATGRATDTIPAIQQRRCGMRVMCWSCRCQMRQVPQLNCISAQIVQPSQFIRDIKRLLAVLLCGSGGPCDVGLQGGAGRLTSAHTTPQAISMVLTTMVLAATAQSGSSPGPAIDGMSVHELKQYLGSRGIPTVGITEKSDLISRAKAAG